MELKKQQAEALEAVRDFLMGETQVFILRGYAGTGKTTLVRYLIDLAGECGRRSLLMAPTGRAAKVLSEKTGIPASTIHRVIFKLHSVEAVEGSEAEESSLQYRFPLSRMEDNPDLTPGTSLLIVDEASMISSVKSNGDLFQFGTGVLLDDIIQYAGLQNGGKVLFMGDPAQLPPVGDAESKALEPSFFRERGLKPAMYELTEIVRQDSDSAILENSIMVRSLIDSEKKPSLILKRKPGEVEDIAVEGIISRYCELAPEPSLHSPAIICYSNRAAAAYNSAVRDVYFPGREHEVQPGDKVIVVGNNYSNEQKPVFNGDYAIVTDVIGGVEKETGVVYVSTPDGKKEHKKMTISFRELELMFDDGVTIRTKVFDDLLGNANPDLTYHERCALMSNFGMRHSELKKKSKEYAEQMQKDPYFNAIKVKYGYATTCHKSQGGEWDTVFVDFSGRGGLNRDCLRWSYTALTRARKTVYGHLLHNISAMQARVMPVARVSAMPENYYPSMETACGPFCTLDQPAPVRARYWQVAEALSGSAYEVTDIRHLPYREVYTVRDRNGAAYRFDGTYNKAGHVSALKPDSPALTPQELTDMMNPSSPLDMKYEYIPSTPALGDLLSKISSLCDENGITITNIVERLSNYKVLYYLRTVSGFAYLDICVNKHGQITYITPRSEVGEEDFSLVSLLRSLTA